jgi:energy-coupling factor transporter ATP-binding protein EcfA2
MIKYKGRIPFDNKKEKNYFISYFFIVMMVFLLSTASLQAMFSREEQDNFRDVSHLNIKAILEKYTSENGEILSSSKNKDIVAFIGTTGSGKSTLINYLSDKELIANEGNIILKNPSDPTTMKIGIGYESETLLPKFINSHNLLFYDLPGIGDTRGTAISLVNSCFIKGIIENARTARLVFVVGHDEITAQKGALFKQLSDITKNLIPNENIENFSSLVVTKSTSGLQKQKLINRLLEKTEPGVLAPFINNQRLTRMSQPSEDQIDQNDRPDILAVIHNTPSRNIRNINSSVIYNNVEKNELKIIYKKEMQDIFGELIQNNFDANTLSSTSLDILRSRKDYFDTQFTQELRSRIKLSSLVKLIRPISKDIYKESQRETNEIISLKRNEIYATIDGEIRRREEENKRIQAEQEKRNAEEKSEREKQEAVAREKELNDKIHLLQQKEEFWKDTVRFEHQRKQKHTLSDVVVSGVTAGVLSWLNKPSPPPPPPSYYSSSRYHPYYHPSYYSSSRYPPSPPYYSSDCDDDD